VYCLKITTVLHLAHGEKDFVIVGMRLEAVNFSIIFTVGKVPNEWKFAQVAFIPNQLNCQTMLTTVLCLCFPVLSKLLELILISFGISEQEQGFTKNGL